MLVERRMAVKADWEMNKGLFPLRACNVCVCVFQKMLQFIDSLWRVFYCLAAYMRRFANRLPPCFPIL